MLSAHWTPDGITLVESEPPPRPSGWARLAVSGCGICGSDLHIERAVKAGDRDPSELAVPGHEIAGTIIDAPVDMPDALYAVEPWVSCRSCAPCTRGDTTLCEDGTLLGVHAGGGLATIVDVPPQLLHRVDDAVGAAVATMAEPWAVAVRAVHKAGLREINERVLVLGGGNIGLLCGLAARDRAAVVGITCRYPHQAELAAAFGLVPIAEADLDTWAEVNSPGVVIETVGGEADTVGDAVRCVRPGGRVVVVGVFGEPRPVDLRALMLKEVQIVGTFIYGTVETGSEFGAAVERMSAVAPELAQLQTHWFPLGSVGEALATAGDKSRRAIKVTITP